MSEENQEGEKSGLDKAMSVVKNAGYAVVQLPPMTVFSTTAYAFDALSIVAKTIREMGGIIYPDIGTSLERFMPEKATAAEYGPCVSLKIVFEPRLLTEYMRRLHPQDERNERA